jgi:hypothetical protein
MINARAAAEIIVSKAVHVFETPMTKVASPKPYGLTDGILE